MSPLGSDSQGSRFSSVNGGGRRRRDARPGRLDYNALAAEEYRRALRSILQARSETLSRSVR